MTLSLFILMGISWTMEIVSFLAGGVAYIWIPTDLLNILTGVYVFVIFVCKPNVWKLLKLKIFCLKKLDDCYWTSFIMRQKPRTVGSDTIDNETTTMSSVITLVHTSIAALNGANHQE